jgi:hypothetical protein
MCGVIEGRASRLPRHGPCSQLPPHKHQYQAFNRAHCPLQMEVEWLSCQDQQQGFTTCQCALRFWKGNQGSLTACTEV